MSWLGFFYGGNIAGAVFGCLLAGFYLLRVHDMAIATFVAAAINVAVAVAGLRCSLARARRTAADRDATADRTGATARPPRGRSTWPSRSRA